MNVYGRSTTLIPHTHETNCETNYNSIDRMNSKECISYLQKITSCVLGKIHAVERSENIHLEKEIKSTILDVDYHIYSLIIARLECLQPVFSDQDKACLDNAYSILQPFVDTRDIKKYNEARPRYKRKSQPVSDEFFNKFVAKRKNKNKEPTRKRRRILTLDPQSPCVDKTLFGKVITIAELETGQPMMSNPPTPLEPRV